MRLPPSSLPPRRRGGTPTTQAQRQANRSSTAVPSIFERPDTLGLHNRIPNINSDFQKAREDVERAKREEEASRPQGVRPRLPDGLAHKEDCIRGYSDAQDDGMAFNFGQQPPASSGQNSGGMFGTAGAGQNKSLFGGGSTPGGGMFGSNTNTPATSGGGGASLFGGTTPSGGMFGSTTPAATSGGNPFGGSTATSGTTGPGLFGSKPATPAGDQNKPTFGGTSGNTSNVFGGGAGNTSSGFNFGQQKPADSAPTSSAAPPTGLFGSKMPTASPAGTPGEQPKIGSGLFGSTPASTAGGGGSSPFGGGATAPQQTWNFGNATSTSGAGDQNKPAATSNVFGSGATPATKPTGPSLFGGAAATPSGATTPQPNKTGPQISFTPAGNPPSNLFGGQANKQNENQQPASSQPQQQTGGGGGGFKFPAFQPSSQQPASTQQSTPSLFAPSTAAQGQGAGTSTAGSMFSKPAASSAAPASSGTTASNLFSLGGGATSSAAPAASSTATPSLFSGLGGGAASSATSQPAATTTSAPSFGFSLGGQTSSSATSQPATTTSGPAPAAGGGGGLFGNPPTTSSGGGGGGSGGGNGGGGGGSLFGGASGGQQPGTSSAAPSTTTTAPASGGLFGAAASTTAAAPSTSGPAPPQQSRLASKSMDEILTMWSTSLASHQKTFQQLAKKVSVWDRQLVENSGKITTLYGRCFQAERDCAEVERQLSTVEHSQAELEAMLDRYEGEVDRLMENVGMGEGGTGIAGVDAERERTYKTAEHCSTRLTEMSHSLTDMIEEINSASTKLGSNQQTSRSADDPLADIVRVLNSHLAQLQTIDSGAAALQGKVASAQREARSLGASQGLNGEAGRWVDEFGRSYLGRR